MIFDKDEINRMYGSNIIKDIKYNMIYHQIILKMNDDVDLRFYLNDNTFSGESEFFYEEECKKLLTIIKIIERNDKIKEILK